MSLMTSRPAVAMRKILRRTGLASPLAALINRRGYEHRVHEALIDALRPGDVVWDVGANVGHYTTQFAEGVGAHGKVFAFEPSPKNRARLEKATADHANVTIVGVALAEKPGQLAFREGSYGDGHDARVVREHEAVGDAAPMVIIETADGIVADDRAEQPTFVKIDVEGFEVDVVRGMHATLRSPRLRVLIIEVHYAQMEEQGYRDGARQLETALKDAGFQISWIGTGHILARRLNAVN